MGYVNPLLRLPAARELMALPAEQRATIVALLRDLRRDADRQAEHSWRRRKGPMAAYWRAVATYARHTAHAMNRAPALASIQAPARHRASLASGRAALTPDNED